MTLKEVKSKQKNKRFFVPLCSDFLTFQKKAVDIEVFNLTFTMISETVVPKRFTKPNFFSKGGGGDLRLNEK